MCFNLEVSLGSFLFSWGISIYLLNKSKKLSVMHRHHVIMLMIFSSMQLADALLWYSKMKKNKLNFIVTSVIIPSILSLQIFYNVFIINKGKNTILNCVALLFSLYWFIKFNGYSKSLCDLKPNSKNKLRSPIWGNSEIRPIEFAIFIFLFLYPHFTTRSLTVMITSVILIHLFFDGAYGSLWCAFANLAALYYLFKY